MSNDPSSQEPVVWAWDDRQPAADGETALAWAGRLYTAVYSRSATGCRVVAQDAAPGVTLWQAALQALGSVHHSKYGNAVQLRIVGNRLAVFGMESAGRYIELLDLDTGVAVYRRVM